VKERWKFRGESKIMPEIKILGDSPTTEDGLGFDPYVNILLEAINNFDASSPLTIGIHGSWGSGKTSLMRMLEKGFEYDNRVKTIWFNAWRYSKEDIIWRAFIMKLLYKLSVFQKRKEADWPKVFGELIKPFFSSNPNLGDIKEAFSYGQRIDSMDEFEKGFKKIVQDVVKDGRLIIFIDDLDRCLPEKTIEILEVIKLFLDVPKCVFVIGVEKEVIERGIEVRYKSREQEIPISGKDYIEKIIQVPFTLPPIREDDMTRFIESLGISEKEKGYAEMVAKRTGCNPRKVKMILNKLRIRHAIAERTGEGIKPELSAKLSFIEDTFPDFYKDILKYREQSFLCMLEKLAKGEADEELRKELEKSETLQKYYKNEDLKSLLKNEPFFCGIDIEPYIYLSGAKAPEEVLVFDESILDELLSGDIVKMWHATSAIKKMPDLDKHQYQDIVTSKLKEKNAEIRVNAVMALRGIGDAKSVEPLINALEDENESVRMNVADALGWIGNAEAVGPLIKALKDDTINVRLHAAPALGRIGDTKAVEPLIAALKGENEGVRVNAADALGRIGDIRAVEPLIEALKDENESVRVNVANALGRIGDVKAIEPLIEALKDENERVRGGAADALRRIGDARAIEPLKEALNDVCISVRSIAKRALEEIKAKQKSM
jgi:uncharacterized protein (UPF0147 family)